MNPVTGVIVACVIWIALVWGALMKWEDRIARHYPSGIIPMRVQIANVVTAVILIAAGTAGVIFLGVPR